MPVPPDVICPKCDSPDAWATVRRLDDAALPAVDLASVRAFLVGQGSTRKSLIDGEYGTCTPARPMEKADLGRISQLVKEFEDMCQRAKDLRSELEGARRQGKFWRQPFDVTDDVRKAFTPDKKWSETTDTETQPQLIERESRPPV